MRPLPPGYNAAMQTDEQAYLLGILEHPAEDFRRLIYADWLEENGQADRCELIRVQLALATTEEECSDCGGTGCPYCGGSGRDYHLSCTRCGSCENTGHNPRWEALKRREQELLDDYNRDVWFSLPGLRCQLEGDASKMYWWIQPSGPRMQGVISRGFVSAIELPCAAFLEHSASIFEVAPVISVRLTDRRPATIVMNRPYWRNAYQFQPRQSDELHADHDLPNDIFRRLKAPDHKHLDAFGRYQTNEEAFADLSQACVAYGRAAANLPALDAVSEPAGV